MTEVFINVMAGYGVVSLFLDLAQLYRSTL